MGAFERVELTEGCFKYTAINNMNEDQIICCKISSVTNNDLNLKIVANVAVWLPEDVGMHS